ncbi:EamA family transporter, partial [Klebsiella pneumoniae]|uniref:EamA family transporter n=1 Tax=Klebsiella pneumoniae TaxID=573 RepID=UPI003EE41848
MTIYLTRRFQLEVDVIGYALSLALVVVVVWGLNFVVIKLGLHNMPPLMLAGLRFMLVAFPALLFVAR